MDRARETEGTEANETEGDDFDSASGGFLEGGEDLDSIVRVGREKVSVDCELVPVMRDELLITDSVSPIS